MRNNNIKFSRHIVNYRRHINRLRGDFKRSSFPGERYVGRRRSGREGSIQIFGDMINAGHAVTIVRLISRYIR